MVELIKFMVNQKQMILDATLQHIFISVLSVVIGALIAIPLGIWLTRKKRIAKPVMAAVGIIQTIPSLVLFGLAMPLLGIGIQTGLIVMVLYSILPILRNTYTGIQEVEQKYVEASRGMGMSNFQILTNVELPLALPVIIAGIRISTVYIISWATIAALINAGGLGDLIFTGLQTYNYNMILSGAIPACILAVLMGAVIGGLQKAVTPKGLRN
ncbi:osmoprotectant transport system permease protein [Anaerobacterium chartisolvens]|uniref:Osmoprotectant transport system permease protein n=1 Tax=Anaerobacterium chartisolvens TaxID=1297424 RepID=A0A369BKK0_9FIRM|nr:ABC transporter permease [Anaerobacterium chartisolvens]RCX20997.1 osmoprotectant transport system permease protein [Anaerobacterium chartisolvens]